MAQLRDWVSDQLHSLLGYSEGYLADYITSLASSEKTAAGLLAKLHASDVPQTAATRTFAVELFRRAPRQDAGASTKARDAAERKERLRDLKHNESYGMVDDEDDEAAETEAAVQRALQERERERLRSQRKRDRGGAEAGGGDAGPSSSAAGDADVAGAGLDVEAAADAERDRDVAERDEFAERLRQRNLSKTRKLGEDALAVVGRREEEAKLLKANDDERGNLLEELRKVEGQY